MTLKFYNSVAKGLKLKVRKVWKLILTFAEVTRKKLVRRERHFSPILNRVKILVGISPCIVAFEPSGIRISFLTSSEMAGVKLKT